MHYQFSSVSQSCLTLCDPMSCSTPGFPVHHQLPKLAQIHIHPLAMPSNHLIFCCPLLLPPSIFPSIRIFSSETVLRIRWPEYWSFELQHQSFQWIFSTDFLEDWLVWSPCSSKDSQESSPTPQFKSINFWHSAFFMVELSHPYMITGKNHSFDCMNVCWQSNVSAF